MALGLNMNEANDPQRSTGDQFFCNEPQANGPWDARPSHFCADFNLDEMWKVPLKL